MPDPIALPKPVAPQMAASSSNVINQFATGRVVSVGELLQATNPATLNRASQPAGPSQQTIAGANSLLPVVYGYRRVGAKIAGVVVHNGNLVLLCVWCHGEINAINGIEINDAATPTGVTVTHYTGTQTQVKDPTLVAAYAAQSPPIVYADDLKGIAYSVVVITPAAAITGFPRIAAYVQGRKVDQVALAYTDLSGSGQYFSTPDSVATEPNEDFEIEACIAPDDWTPAATQTIVSKWNGGTNQRSYIFALTTTGALTLWVSTNGSTSNSYTSSANLSALANGALLWVKVVFQKTNGANSTANFSTSVDGFTYTALGVQQTSTVVATIFNSTSTSRVGADEGGGFSPFDGRIWKVRVDGRSTKRLLDFTPWNANAGASTWIGGNGETWTGAGGAVVNAGMNAWSRIPADCLADFIASTTYGLGKTVDFASLFQCVLWNSELLAGPPSETRHQIDLMLDSSLPVEDWLNVLRDYAHCWIVPEGSTYFLIRDANDGIDGAFTSAEIIQDSLQVRKRSARNQPTAVQVTYTDVSQVPWRDVPVTEWLPGVLGGTVPRRMSKISKPGITRLSEAKRYAIERLNDATLSDTMIDCVVDDSAMSLRVGGIYNFTHPIGFSAKPFRVIRCRPMLGRYSITAVEFDPALYSNVVVTQPTIVDTTLPSPNNPPTLTGLTATEDVVQTKDGLYVSRIRVDWADPANFPVSFIDSYRVRIYDPTLTLVHSANVTVRPIVTPPLKELVTYTCFVAVVSATGIVGAEAAVSITPQGKLLPPSNVSSIAGFEAGGRVFLSWSAAVDLSLDTIRYEIRYGSTASTWDTASLIDRVSALTYATPGFAAGVYRFFVKAVDSVGNYSTSAAYVDVIVSVDNAAFSAYSYTNVSVGAIAMTENVIAGQRIATTDWGDGMEKGHATHLNTTGLWNDGSVAGSVVGTQPHGQALRFYWPANRYVSIPYVASHNLGTTFALMAWIYPTSYDSTRRAIFSQRTANDAGGWDLGLVNDKLQMTGTSVIATSSTSIPLFKWTHVCVRVIAGATVLIINGVQETTYTTGPLAYTYLNNTNARYIGAIRSGALFPFDGLIRQTKMFNTSLTVANVQTLMQYDDNPTSIAGMVGNWKGADSGQGSTSTTYADSGSGLSNGTVTPDVDWRSWSFVLSAAVDLTQTTNGTFTVSGGDVISLNGAVGPLIWLSNDAITWTEYRQPTVVGSARFFRFGYESQGGSMSVNLTTMRGDVLVTPRSELVTVTCATSGVQSAYLSGLYAKVIDLQLTPSQTSSAQFAVPDQIEVAPYGISGGAAAVKLLGNTNSYFSRTATLSVGTSQTVEVWAHLDATQALGLNLWNVPNNASTTIGTLYIGADYSIANNSAAGTDIFMNGTQPAYMPLQRWVHLAVVFDPVANLTLLYMNGVFAGSAPYRDPTNNASRTYHFGYPGPSFDPMARLYDYRIWNVARTAQQILDNYKSRIGAQANLLVYLKGDEKTGTTLTDSSGNALDFAAAGVLNTDYKWRPINGFDAYLFNNAATRQNGDVRARWTGA